MQDADERLARREARRHLGAQRLGLHRVDEGLDDRQRHVRLEQRHAHFAQRFGDVVFGDAAAAAQAVDRAGEPGCQIFEHGDMAGL